MNNITKVLVSVVFVMLLVGMITGWVTANNNAKQLVFLQQDQLSVKKTLSRLDRNLGEATSELDRKLVSISTQLNDGLRNIDDIQARVSDGTMRDKQLSASVDQLIPRMNGLAPRVEKLAGDFEASQRLYGRIISKIDELDERMKVSDVQSLKKIELGEVAVEKRSFGEGQ
ncbi:MAG: hypothetical protein ABH858_06945 [Candidatus Omnitrophota bacterium]